MAEFMHIQDSRHSSQNNLFCVLNEDINKKPSHKLKGRFWNKKFCFLLMCGTVILFMALLITVSVKLQHQYSKVSEVENEVANLTSSLALLSSNQQDTSRHQNSKLTEVENEVANLTSSLALLSSNQQDTLQHQNSKLTEVENEVANLTSSLALLSSNQQDTLQHQNSKLTEVENEVANLTSSLALLSSNQKDTLQHQNSKLTEVENEVANLTSSLALLSSNQKDTLQHQNSKLTEVENEVANLTSSLALLSSNQQETLQHQNSKLTEVENEVANLTSSLALLSSNQQDTYDRFMEMVGELKADLDSRITNLTQHKPVLSCKAGWQPFLSNCYEFSSQKLSWQKARSYCSGKGTLMLILGNDSREWDFIVQHAVRSSESYWIGLTDTITGHWRWVDGTPYTMNSSQWEPGEPNNWRGEEDCGELTASGKLNDGNCSKNFRFICKAPASEN